jgi:hypothetical protein
VVPPELHVEVPLMLQMPLGSVWSAVMDPGVSAVNVEFQVRVLVAVPPVGKTQDVVKFDAVECSAVESRVIVRTPDQVSELWALDRNRTRWVFT